MTENCEKPTGIGELRTLLAAAVLGDASDGELDRLNELLMGDVELRHYASRFLEEETVLRREFEMLSRVVDFHSPTSSPLSRFARAIGREPAMRRDSDRTGDAQGRGGVGGAFVFSVILAASVLFVMFAAGFWMGDTRELEATRTAPQRAQPIEVGLLVQGQLLNGGTDLRSSPATPFRVGDVITTDIGLTSLQFSCGAEVLLKGPAELEVLSPRRAALRRGTLTARVEERAHGFRIDTPNSKVIDLGTEFGLSVDENGATDMVVFSGKVALEYAEFRSDDRSALHHPMPFNQGRLLTDGEAMRITESGEVKRLVAVRSSDYPLPSDRGREPPDQAPIIESVSDNLREGDTTKCYRIVSRGFGEDARAFVDRPYQWNGLNAEHGLPSFLSGADYVMPFCDDKLSTRLEVRIAISRPARIYVLIDNRVELPQWLTDKFSDTGYDVGVDESDRAASWLSLGSGPGVSIDKSFSAWFMDVAEPSTVVLGPMRSPIIQSLMYCVAAIPLEVAMSTEAEPLRYHQPRIGSGHIRADLLPAPVADALIERVDSFSRLTIAASSADDAASSSNGVAFRVESIGGKYQPHSDVAVEHGTLPRLNDGHVARNNDDLERNVWYNGQGRFSVDLLKPTKITQINTFSWHWLERAPQFFTVWGSNESEMPPTTFDEANEADGWQLIGFVKTSQLGDGGIHASSLRGKSGSLGPYRYLLWITEDTVNGTFFTEIDVHETSD